MQNPRQRYAIESKNRKRLLEVNPSLTDESGIYFLTRTDENGFRYAYIGQAVHILQRLAQHLVGYQHIDLSLKNMGYTLMITLTVGKSGFLISQYQNWINRNSTILKPMPIMAISCVTRQAVAREREKPRLMNTDPLRVIVTALDKGKSTLQGNYPVLQKSTLKFV